MKIFKGFNTSGEPCPICNTKDDKETVLMPIEGTNFDDDGSESINYMAMAVHLDCIELIYNPTYGLMVQKIPKPEFITKLIAKSILEGKINNGK